MAPTAAVLVLLMVVITSVGGSGAPAAGGGSAASPAAAAAALLLRQEQELEIRGLLDPCSGDCRRCILSSAQACLDGCPSLKTTVTCFVDQIPIIKECLRSGSGSAPPASVRQVQVQVQVMPPGGSAATDAASPPTALLQQQQKVELRDLLSSCSFPCWKCLFDSVLPCGFSAFFMCGNPLSSAVTCVAQQIPTMEGCLRGN